MSDNYFISTDEHKRRWMKSDRRRKRYRSEPLVRAGRFITKSDLSELADILRDSDDPEETIESALSQIGIDPAGFSADDIEWIEDQLDVPSEDDD